MIWDCYCQHVTLDKNCELICLNLIFLEEESYYQINMETFFFCVSLFFGRQKGNFDLETKAVLEKLLKKKKKTGQKSQKSTCNGVLLSKTTVNGSRKRTLWQVFSCEFSDIY